MRLRIWGVGRLLIGCGLWSEGSRWGFHGEEISEKYLMIEYVFGGPRKVVVL